MAIGAYLIWDTLTTHEKELVSSVVLSEAERQLKRDAPSGLFDDTKAEENAWDIESLAAAIMLFPGHSKKTAWREKLIEFSVNSLSAPQDTKSDETVDGRPLKDLIYTTNIHSDSTLENHGAYHFCYVASVLVSLAWSYLALLQSGEPVPEAVFHGVQRIWERVKPTFLDNRFAYMGGQDWARYTYGSYFIVPAAVMICARYGDPDAQAVEMARLKRLEEEQDTNNDGSFFGSRVSKDRFFGQSAKYETDCYANMGLAYLLHKKLLPSAPQITLRTMHQKNEGTHISYECGLCYLRSEDLFASYSQRNIGRKKGGGIFLFVPDGADDLIEWAEGNLLGTVDAGQTENPLRIISMKKRDKGFAVKGIIAHVREGAIIIDQHISLEVDGKSKIALIENRFIAKRKIFIRSSAGLALHIANDLFNDFERGVFWDGRPEGLILKSNSSVKKRTAPPSFVPSKIGRILGLNETKHECHGRWINIEDKVGVITLKGDGRFTIRQSIYNTASNSLSYDVIENPACKRNYFASSGESILDTKFLIAAGPRDITARLAAAYKE